MADLLYQVLKTVLPPVLDRYFDLRAAGRENLPPGPFVLAPNHSSMLDWAFVARFIDRPVRFLLSRTFYEQAGVTWAYRQLGVIPVREYGIEPSSLREVLAVLGRGEILGCFPEGRITRDGTLQPGQPGAIVVAARAGVPIVPVGVRGAFEAFPRDAAVPRPRPVRVRFGEPVHVPAEAARDRRAQLQRAAALMRLIADLRTRA